MVLAWRALDHLGHLAPEGEKRTGGGQLRMELYELSRAQPGLNGTFATVADQFRLVYRRRLTISCITR